MSRNFTGDLGDGKLGDVRVIYHIVRAGLFIWSPKGLFTGSERTPKTFRISWNWYRHQWDSGSGFADEDFNAFNGMRRFHVTQNTILLKWFHRRNLIFNLEYDIYNFNKMKSPAGTTDDLAAEARKLMGFLSTGGTYQAIILGARFNF